VFSEGGIKNQFITNLIGSLRAQQFCFNQSNGTSGCGGVGGGGGNRVFYQVSFPDPRKIPAELPASSGVSGDRWLVNIVPGSGWSAAVARDTLPTTPTGTCQYQ